MWLEYAKGIVQIYDKREQDEHRAAGIKMHGLNRMDLFFPFSLL